MPTRFSVDGVPSAIYSICQPESWGGGSVQNLLNDRTQSNMKVLKGFSSSVASCVS